MFADVVVKTVVIGTFNIRFVPLSRKHRTAAFPMSPPPAVMSMTFF
jgi:hypothetical protein